MKFEVIVDDVYVDGDLVKKGEVFEVDDMDKISKPYYCKEVMVMKEEKPKKKKTKKKEKVI